MASLRTALFERVDIFLEESSNSVSAYKEIYTVAERAQRAANRKNTCKLRKHFLNLTTHTLQMLPTQPKKKRAVNRKEHLQIKKTTCSIWQHMLQNAHNTTKKKKHAANKMYLVVLWAFAVCFFICLCCEHFHHVLYWWKCFLDLLVLHVFWSRSALSSLGHRRNYLA